MTLMTSSSPISKLKKYENFADTPVLPKNASRWKAWDAEQIGIRFRQHKVEQDKWRKLLKEKISSSVTISKWGIMVKAFKDLMDEIPYSPSASSMSRLIRILNSHHNNAIRHVRPKSKKDMTTTGSTDEDDDNADEDDIEFVKAERRAVGDGCKEMRLEFSCVVDQMVEKTGIQKGPLKNIFITQLVLFLGDFQIMLRNWEQGRPPLEAAFQNLFRMFANIFMIPFRPGDAEDARSMKIFGQQVVCKPDLRYQLNSDITGDKAERDSFVVTIAEVKKISTFTEGSRFGIGLHSSRDVVKPSTGTTTSEKISSSPPMKRLKAVPVEEEVDLPDDIKGQHAVELLMEIPFSTVRDSEKMKCALGLIIQGTKVRLTWLEITLEHFELIQEEKFKELDDDTKAYISYSQGYDMFVKEDRRNLVEILMGMAAIGEKAATPFWQSLMPLLPVKT
ncbi:uncharacterized protein LOC135493045 isoform X1 [Lineus longissimus]